MSNNAPEIAKASYPLREALPTIRILVALMLLTLLAATTTTLEQQVMGSTLIVLFMWVITLVWRDRPQRAGYEIMRNAMIFLTMTMSLRYLIWRGTDTLPLEMGPAAIIAGLLLFGAECYCFVVSAMGHLPNLRNTSRVPLPLPADPRRLPTVDVFIPTYNEEPELVRSTIIAATQMRYPSDKLRVYVLDDGGTAQQLANPDPVRAASARERAERIRAIATRFGAIYLTRERNEHAKAGNMNDALRHTRGEFIVALDCDHVPAEDFIEKTLGFFLADRRLFLVQTPHHFVNPDPLERNLSTFSHSPSENDMFYNTIQPGLDAWGATFFCGSAAMLRRSALEDIGGFSQQTLTEDAETTLRALSRGYTTAYLNLPLISGLQPETFSGFIQQRARWGQGMWQIFLFSNPWRMPRLRLMQRVLFTNFALYWGFPVSRLVLMLMPPVALLLFVPLADASVIEVLAYGAPAMLCSTMTAQFVYGKVRWPFISYLYEVIQSVHLSASIAHLLYNPRAPQFRVTPKGEILEKDFVSVLARPFYLLSALSMAALAMGLYRLATEPQLRDMLYFISGWALLDLIFLLCALGVTLERKQRRVYPRATVDYPVRLRTDNGLDLRGTLVNASATGAGIKLVLPPASQTKIRQANDFELTIDGIAQTLDGRLQKLKVDARGHALLGLAYRFRDIAQERAAIAVPYGSSEQLVRNLRRRHRRRSVVLAFFTLLKKAIFRGGGHLLLLARQGFRVSRALPGIHATEKKQ